MKNAQLKKQADRSGVNGALDAFILNILNAFAHEHGGNGALIFFIALFYLHFFFLALYLLIIFINFIAISKK